jgi:hypothetical protein
MRRAIYPPLLQNPKQGTAEGCNAEGRALAPRTGAPASKVTLNCYPKLL